MNLPAPSTPPMITYCQISEHDREYAQEKELRDRVLRSPLGLRLSEQDVRDEDKQIHLVAMNEQGQVIGCAVVALYDEVARIRQMAVEEPYRGQGIGTELVRRAEQSARARNVQAVNIHARVSARGFYEGLGYSTTSEVFSEATIPHITMVKNLAGPPRE